MAVARTGGSASIFSSSTATTGQTLLFALPASTNYLLVAFSIYISGAQASSVTWKPDPGDASKDQAFTFLGFRGTGVGRCEFWGLPNPNASASGALIDHVMSTATKRIMGVQAFSGVGSIGTPVGNDSASAATLSCSVTSEAAGMVSDVMHVTNSTTSRTATSPQTERWDTGTSGGTNNLGGGGSDKAGAAGSVSMGWTIGTASRLVVYAIPINASGTLPVSKSGAGSLSQSVAQTASGIKGAKGVGTISQSRLMSAGSATARSGTGIISQAKTMLATGVKYTGPQLSGSGIISQTKVMAAQGVKAARGVGTLLQPVLMSIGGHIVFPGTVLADAIAIYVGEVPVVAVYAGTVRDWPP